MQRRIEVVHEGKTFFWLGRGGVVTSAFTKPSAAVEHAVMAKVEGLLAEHDANLSGRDALLEAAQVARANGQLARAEKLAWRALNAAPTDASVATVLSSILRARHEPEKALEVTAAFAGGYDPALLTTRAAAMADVGEYGEARKLADRAYALIRRRGESRSEVHALYERLRAEAGQGA